MFRHTFIGAALALACAATSAADFFKKDLDPSTDADGSFLPVDEAFEIQPLELKDDRLQVSWRIAPGYYLYRQRLSFRLLEPAGTQLGAAQLPAGEVHEDEHFGVVEVYRSDPQKANRFTAELPLTGIAPNAIKLEVGYQGCADAGLCYPPQTRTLEYVHRVVDRVGP